MVLGEDGTAVMNRDGENSFLGQWKGKKGFVEVVINANGLLGAMTFRIEEPNGDLTFFALHVGDMRSVVPKEERYTLRKIR